MSINYDPDGKPEIDSEMMQMAKDLGMHIVNVICDEPGAKVGDPGGVSFAAVMPFLPRVGEEIELEDGRICRVQKVMYRVVTQANGCVLLFPNVAAVLVKQLPKKHP